MGSESTNKPLNWRLKKYRSEIIAWAGTGTGLACGSALNGRVLSVRSKRDSSEGDKKLLRDAARELQRKWHGKCQTGALLPRVRGIQSTSGSVTA